LSNAIGSGSLTVATDRLELVSDAFAMARAGMNSTVSVLDIIAKYREHEENYTVWVDLISNLNDIDRIVANTPAESDFNRFGRHLIGEAFKRVGWDAKTGELHTVALLRSLLLGKLGTYGDPDVIAEAKNRFSKGADTLPADMRGAVYNIVVANGDKSDYDKLYQMFKVADMQEEKQRCLRSLARTKNTDLLLSTLELSLSSEVRSQDSVFCMGSVAANPLGRDRAWEFFKKNVERVKSILPGLFLVSRLVQLLTADFSTEEKAIEVETFFRENPMSGTERAVLQSIEAIRSNASWSKRDSGSISQWLKSYHS